MITAEQPLIHTTQAIFSVCVDEPVVQAAITASRHVSGSVYAGEFNDYITAEKRPQFSSSLKGAESCVALIDFDKDPELALKTTERLQTLFLKKISVVAVASTMEAGLLVRAMRAGCKEYLIKPVDPTELQASFARFQESMAVDTHSHGSLGRVIAIFGAKGGVGTTTLAVHLAIHLVRQQGKKVLLIDHKHQLGHVALYLGLKDTQYHFDELLRNADRLDSELLNGFVIRHISGLEVIASPEMAEGIHESKRDDLERVMDFLRRQYDYVLIDSSMGYQDSKVAIIDQAEEVYLVSTPDVASLRDLSRQVESMNLNGVTSGKLKIIVNRSTADDSITPEQIEKAVRFPISIAVPNNYFELLRAINSGEPVAPQRRSEFNLKLSQWADQIVNGGAKITAAPASKRKVFARWR